MFTRISNQSIRGGNPKQLQTQLFANTNNIVGNSYPLLGIQRSSVKSNTPTNQYNR